MNILLPLLVASVYALPDKPHHDKDKDKKNVCGEKLDGIGTNAAGNIWSNYGSQIYLNEVVALEAKGWSNRLFHKAGMGGYDCSHLSLNTCGAPDRCHYYHDPEAYLIHTSIANLDSAFTWMHETLQDKKIYNLAKGTSDIEDAFDIKSFGDGSVIISILIGVFVGATAEASSALEVLLGYTSMKRSSNRGGEKDN